MELIFTAHRPKILFFFCFCFYIVFFGLLLVPIGFYWFFIVFGTRAVSQKECAAARSTARVRSPGTLNATAPWLLYLTVLTVPSENPMQSRKKPIQTMKNQSEPIENQKTLCKNQNKQKQQ